ncbi:MAG TPA: TonB-dependent receptor [Pyrinomonadaceae bacterium]|jgi:outer membrane receptor protein involved in Fe transport
MVVPFSAARVFACALTLLLCLTSSSAQSPSTRVEGVVQDQTGAAVVRASVTLRNGSAIVAESITDSGGRFRLEVSTPADTVSVRAEGFAPFESRLSVIRTNLLGLEIVLAPAPLSERVTVTATRTETRLGETAASVVTLSQTELTTTAAATLDDALRQVPGFSLFRRSGSRTANPTTQGVSLRGVGASGASRAVVLADGVPLNDPFGGWVYWGRVPRTSVNTVEVLRGGASHLYGSAALGGVVNVITRRPTDSPSLRLEASYGNQQTADASLFAAGRRGGWGASVGVETFHTDGYVIVDERERGSVDVPAGVRNAVARLSVERRLSNNASVFMSANVFGEARSNGTPFQRNRTHVRQFVIGGDWRGARAGAFTARAYGGTQVFDQNFSAVNDARTLETPTRVQRVPAQAIGASLQWSRAAFTRQTFIAGLEAREARGASDELAFVSGRPTSIIGAGGRERTLGTFFEDIIRATPDLFVTVGARVDHWRNYDALSATRPFSTNVTRATLFPDRTEMAFSPHLSLLYKPRENVSLYASMNRAFRQPTLNELYRSFRVGDVLTLANENLRAERLTEGEAGAGFNAFGQKLNVRGAFFWTELTRPVANVTLSVTPALITRQRQNLGRTRSRGLELEWDARLTNTFTVSGGYLFADATVVSFPANTALEGLLIPQVPRHQLTFQARYANPSILTAALQGRASGAQFDDDQNRFRLAPYFTLDAFASRRLTRTLEGFVALENIFDRRYTTGLTPIRTIGPPTLARFGFRLFIGSH